MMGQARENARRLGLGYVRLQQGDVGALPFAVVSFDAVLSMNGFRAFPDKGTAYRETVRELKPGGAFCGCYYVQGGWRRTDWCIRHVYQPMKFFNPSYESRDSLQARLNARYDSAETDHVKGIVWFRCRKADQA